MNQIDKIAHDLGPDQPATPPHGPKGGALRRRILLAGVGVLAVAGAGGAGVYATRSSRDPAEGSGPSDTSEGATASPVKPLPEGVEGTAVLSGPAGTVAPVLAPGGAGACADSTGRALVVTVDGAAATGQDVITETMLVAGEADGQDVIAWAGKTTIGWWSPTGGLQRMEHERPVALSSDGGGILATDDHEWTARVTTEGLEELALPSGADPLGVLSDGTLIFTDERGYLTSLTSENETCLFAPSPPEDSLSVARIAGLVGAQAVLVWRKAGKPTKAAARKAWVSLRDTHTGDSSDGSTARWSAVKDADLVHAGDGRALLGGLLIHEDGRLLDVEEHVEPIGLAGGRIRVRVDGEEAWLDPESGKVEDPPTDGVWTLENSVARWVGDEHTVWFAGSV